MVNADCVVSAQGIAPENALYTELSGSVPELYRIGSAAKPVQLYGAVAQAVSLAGRIN